MPALFSRFSAFFVVAIICALIPHAAPGSAATLSAPPALGGAQTGPPRQLRVAVQIGHYKNSELPEGMERLMGHTGTSGGGRTEVELNLDVSNRVARLLRAQGVAVEILPATVPTSYTADAFVAIHADGSPSSTPRGFKISTRWSSQIPVQDAHLVEELTAAYRAATGLPEDSNVTRNMRGYYAYAPWRPNYRVSNLTPGAIVEMGYMTNPSDRAVMFKATDKVAQGITSGIMQFLRGAYPSITRGVGNYGYGMLDSHIDPSAPPFPPRKSGPGPRMVTGNWDILLMGSETINVYAGPGTGGVIAKLPRGRFYHSVLRRSDYYKITLPGGKEGWIHRNAAIAQM